MERDLCLLSLFLFLGSCVYSRHTVQHCGMTCDTCDEGYYGPNCTLACSNCQHKECNKTTGKCDNCDYGYYGRRCNKTCPPRCGSRACNRDNGACDDGCNALFWGPRCERNCSSMCNGSVCIKDSGKCHLGCKDGWTGLYCNISCETGCVNTRCAQMTKECLECMSRSKASSGCKEDGLCNMCSECQKVEICKAKSTQSKLKNGTLDESKTNTPETGGIIGGLFGVVVIVSLVVVAVIVYKRRHRQHQGGPEPEEPEAATLSHTPQTDAKHESDRFPVEEA